MDLKNTGKSIGNFQGLTEGKSGNLYARFAGELEGPWEEALQ